MVTRLRLSYRVGGNPLAAQQQQLSQGTALLVAAASEKKPQPQRYV